MRAAASALRASPVTPPDHTAVITKHMPWVLHIARRLYHNSYVPEDAIAEGYEGLVIAAQRFDPSHNVKFATYASFWIRARILQYIVASHGPVRIGRTDCQRKVFFGLAKARRSLGEGATLEALAERLGVTRVVLEEVGQYLESNITTSFDRHNSNSVPLADMLPAPEPTPVDAYEAAEHHERLREQVRAALSRLDSRERRIIRARWLSNDKATLDELGTAFGCTKEWIRQLEERAFDKMRRYLRRVRACA